MLCLCLVTMLFCCLASVSFSDDFDCGPLENGVGPWDYRDPTLDLPTGDAPKGRRKLVENVHFKRRTEALDGNLEVVAGDLAYTLRAFPNHPRAMLSLARLEDKLATLPKGRAKPKLSMTLECAIDRALRFVSDDPVIWEVQGIVLHRRKRYEAALEAYGRAEELGRTSAQLDYNVGLLLFDMQRYDESVVRATRAYGRGFPLQGLRNKLSIVGRTVQ